MQCRMRLLLKPSQADQTAMHGLYLLEHGTDSVLGFHRDVRPGVSLEVDVALGHSVEDLLLGLAPEGRHAAQQDVQDDPAAPDVRLLAIAPLQHLQ